METALACKSFLSTVEIALIKYKEKLEVLYTFKTILLNFSLSLKDKTYVEIVISNVYLYQVMDSIINKLEQIACYYVMKSKIKKLIFSFGFYNW